MSSLDDGVWYPHTSLREVICVGMNTSGEGDGEEILSRLENRVLDESSAERIRCKRECDGKEGTL
jgi:hypothetical protein